MLNYFFSGKILQKHYLYRKIGRFWNMVRIIGNNLPFVAKSGQVCQNNKVNSKWSCDHYAVKHAITFYGTLVVIGVLISYG